jgi:hypothetical protein
MDCEDKTFHFALAGLSTETAKDTSLSQLQFISLKARPILNKLFSKIVDQNTLKKFQVTPIKS